MKILYIKYINFKSFIRMEDKVYILKIRNKNKIGEGVGINFF